jgi:hypothetical protein
MSTNIDADKVVELALAVREAEVALESTVHQMEKTGKAYTAAERDFQVASQAVTDALIDNANAVSRLRAAEAALEAYTPKKETVP